MDVEPLRTFLEVLETGHFGRAARNLFVSQSTVSARIRALEQQLDRRLFLRGRAGARPTAAGRRLERHARAMLRLWQHASYEVGLPEGFEGSFTCGLQVSLWRRLGPRWVAWMQQRAPVAALNLRVEYSDAQMRQITAGVIDVGVMYGPHYRRGLIVEELFAEQLCLVSTTPHPEPGLPPDYIYVDWGEDYRIHHAEAFPEADTAAVSVSLGALAVRLLADAGGSAYLPLWVAEPLLARGAVFRVPDAPVFRRPAFAVHRESSADDPLMRTALEGLRTVAAAPATD